MSRNMSRHLRLKHPRAFGSESPHLDKTPIEDPLKSTVWVKGNWGKKYCTRVFGHKYKCNMCETVLSLSNGLFFNVKRHIKSKHPYIYEKEVSGHRSDEEVVCQKDESVSDTEESLNKFVEEAKVKSKTDNEDEEGNTGSGTEALAADGVALLNENDPGFATKVKYFVNKHVSDECRKRSFLWNFFKELDRNLVKCKLCSRKMNRNMSRHLRLKHPKVFRSVSPYLDKTPIKGPLKSTSWLKGSWGRKYCTRVFGNKYKCNMCETVLSLSNGLFGNMKRHIKTKHPYIYEKEVGGGRSDEEVDCQKDESVSDTEEFLSEFIEEAKLKSKTDNEDEEGNTGSDTEAPAADSVAFLNEDDPEFVTKVKYLVNKQVSGKKRAKNCFWNFFNVVKENHLYTCLACNRRVAIFPHSIANLKRHIRMRHKYQYSIMMKCMVECESSGKLSPISFDKYYFNREGDSEYKCKECDSIVTCTEEDQQTLFDHIKDSHPDQIMAYQEESMEDDDELNIVVVKE